MIEYKNIIPKLNRIFNLIIRILTIVIIMAIYINVDIEFDMRIPFMFVEVYIIEKIFMNKENKQLLLKRNFENKYKYFCFKIIYILLIELSFISSLAFSTYHPGYKYAIVYTAIPLFLYNGDKGRKNKIIQGAFYAVFPLQHFLYYLSAMIICK